MHGQVERVIKSVQESFKDSGLLSGRYHATGLQTMCKIVENQYNNLPLGYHFARDQDNGPLLKMICPNHLRVGRMNKRALDGPVRLPKNKMEMLKTVEEVYQAWFRLWRDTCVPKLMFKPKWFKTDRDLLVGDLVYFVKKDGALDNKWIIGMVESVDRGRDGVIRKATIKYCNSSEQRLSLKKGEREDDSTYPRYTERAVRKLVKIFSLEETSLANDLAELDKKEKETEVDRRPEVQSADDNAEVPEETENGGTQSAVDSSGGGKGPASNTRSKVKCQLCCCTVHCEYKLHFPTKVKQEEMGHAMDTKMMTVDIMDALEGTDTGDDEVEDLMGVLNSVNLDISKVFRN